MVVGELGISVVDVAEDYWHEHVLWGGAVLWVWGILSRWAGIVCVGVVHFCRDTGPATGFSVCMSDECGCWRCDTLVTDGF